MDGAAAPQRRGTARWLLVDKGRRKRARRWTKSTTVMGSDGWRDDESRVMEGAERRRGMVRPRRQLDGKGRRDGDSTTMEDEEPCKRDGDVDVDMAGGGSNTGQRGIKL